MKKTTKFSLDDLKVQSFVTTLKADEQLGLKGGEIFRNTYNETCGWGNSSAPSRREC